MSQDSIVTPTTGPATAATMFGDVNGALEAIQSQNSGSSAPANGNAAAPTTFQTWFDTTSNPVVAKWFDGTSWVVFGKLDTSAHTWTPSYKGTDLGTASTATTGSSGHTLGFLDGVNTISAVWSGLTAAVDTNTTQLATTAFVLGQGSASGDGTPAMDGSASRGTGTHFARNDHVHPTDTSRAPLASPTLTGTPSSPTATIDTSTTQLATTAFVLGQGSQSGDGTPAMDGTASRGSGTHFARNDHVHPTDTSRAPLASPTFTGTPAAPTATPGTNTTQLASTAFVAAAVTAGVSGVASVNGLTGAVSVTSSALTVAPSGASVALSLNLPDVIVEEQQTSGTNGGTFTSGSWQTRLLSTLVRNANSIASLASNQVTLPAGTYYLKWSAPAFQVTSHKTRIQNVTDSTTIALGTSDYSSSTDGQSSSVGSFVVTLTASKAIALQHQCAVTKSGNGLGVGASFGTEIFSRLEITKLQ